MDDSRPYFRGPPTPLKSSLELPKFSSPSDTHHPLKTAGIRGFWKRYARLETTHPPKVGQRQPGSADSVVCYHNYTAPANEQGPAAGRRSSVHARGHRTVRVRARPYRRTAAAACACAAAASGALRMRCSYRTVLQYVRGSSRRRQQSLCGVGAMRAWLAHCCGACTGRQYPAVVARQQACNPGSEI
jgi:hypothetical protein